MAHCLSCYSYVNETAVCACDARRRSQLRVVQDDHDTYGLRKRDWTFRNNMIKGKLAETLVEQLFLSHKYNVYRYGMEHAVPGIAGSIRKDNSPVARQIKSMPDFVVQHRIKRQDTHYVEVKFRWNGRFSGSELEKEHAHENALIIVVSRRHIKCLSVNELKQGKEITESSFNYLADRPEFDLRRDVVIDFCDFAKGFFEMAPAGFRPGA